jgi:hypothetical protein
MPLFHAPLDGAVIPADKLSPPDSGRRRMEFRLFFFAFPSRRADAFPPFTSHR